MSKTRVLIVEDEVIVAMDLKMRLERMGFEAPEPPDPTEFSFQSIARESPDVVLMDIRLGDGVDGVSLAEEVSHKLDVPVIFVTAHSDTTTLDRAGKTNPYGYLIKPVKDRELQVAITMALHKHRAESQLRKLFTNMPSGVLVLRWDDGVKNFLVESVNPAAIALDRLSEDMEGHSLASYLMRCPCYDLEGAGCFGLIETTHQVWKEGVSRPYTLTAVRDGAIVGWREYFIYRSSRDEVTMVFSDVTEQKRLEEALRLRTSDMMYSMNHLSFLRSSLEASMESRLSVRQRMVYIADFMAQAVQEPEDMSVRICWMDQEIRNSGFQGMAWTFSRPLFSAQEKVGSVEWGYSAEKEHIFEGPFTREEVDLFESLVQIISHLVDDYRRELEFSAQIDLYQGLLAMINSPLAYLDMEGRIKLVNRAFEQKIDMGNDEIASLPVDMIPLPCAKELGAAVARVSESGVGESVYGPDGEVELRPALDKRGDVSGVLMLFHSQDGEPDESL